MANSQQGSVQGEYQSGVDAAELTLVIGNKNYSSWSLRPWFFLKMTGIPFNEVQLSLGTDFRQQVTQYSMAGKVPVLLHEGQAIWDSLAIGEYISEALLAGKGWPDSRHQRAWARSIVAEMHSGYPNLRREMPMNCRRVISGFQPGVAAQQDIRRIVEIWHDCRKAHHADGPWLFGRFTLADAMFAPVASRFHSYQVPLDTLAADYVQTVLNTPAYQAWLAGARGEEEVLAVEEV